MSWGLMDSLWDKKEKSRKSKVKSSFGNRFKEAAEKAQVRYQCESFESSLIEIHKNDF
jgi:hypothetical protein